MAKKRKPKSKQQVASAKSFERSILYLRDQHVVIDRELSEFYGVSTKQLNQAIKRNPQKFPSDFMFQLQKPERDEVTGQRYGRRRNRY